MSDLEALSDDEAVDDSSSNEDDEVERRRKLSYSLMYDRGNQVL